MTTDSIRSIRHNRASLEREGASSYTAYDKSPTAVGMKRASDNTGGEFEVTTKGVSWDVGGTGVVDLDACQSTVTLKYFTDEPDPIFNRQLLVCRANANYPSLSSEAITKLNVECK
jgi:hypothetical protein